MSRTPRAPLSSFADVPLTEETKRSLHAEGITVTPGMGEMEGRSFLAIASGGGQEGPPCFALGFDPTSPLCAGCLCLPRCWAEDEKYLARLSAGETKAPPGVPAVVIQRVVGTITPKPKKRRKKPAPPKVKL